jgi:hypothetical protein
MLHCLQRPAIVKDGVRSAPAPGLLQLTPGRGAGRLTLLLALVTHPVLPNEKRERGTRRVTGHHRTRSGVTRRRKSTRAPPADK